METNNSNQSPVITTGALDSKPSQKQKYTMIALAVVAAIGVGFGIVGTVIGLQKSNDVRNLEVQLAEKTENLGDVSELPDNCSPTTISAGEEQELQENLTVDSDSGQKYIYVSEWGKRYRIPDNLTSVSFAYNSADNGNQSLCVTGVKVIPGGMHYFPEFGNIFPEGVHGANCLGTVVREWNSQSNQYDFRYYHPQAVYSDGAEEINWEVESTNLIQEMLTKNAEDI